MKLFFFFLLGPEISRAISVIILCHFALGVASNTVFEGVLKSLLILPGRTIYLISVFKGRVYIGEKLHLTARGVVTKVLSITTQ